MVKTLYSILHRSLDLTSWVITELNNIKKLNFIRDNLIIIQKKIRQYNKTSFGFGIKKYKEIEEITNQFDGVKSKSFLQVDSEIENEIELMDHYDVEKIEEFASFLTDLTKYNQNNFFDEFKIRFLEKYGEYIEVPIYELLDEDIGIGAPMNYNNPSNKYTSPIFEVNQKNKLSDYLMNLYLEAIQNKKNIVIDENEIKKLNISNLSVPNIPDNLELNFFIKNDGKKNLYHLGPNIGSNMAGKTFGRFSYLSNQHSELIKKFNETSCIDESITTCEISYVPKSIRSANVTRNDSQKIKNLTIQTSSHDRNNQVQMKDILVGLKNNQFYIRDKKSNDIISISSNNMLNPTIADNGIRLLQEISLQNTLMWSNFPWSQIYDQFTYVPEIKYKDIIIETELWKITSITLKMDKEFKKDDFLESFRDFRIMKNIPSKFYLQNADNRILIDCNNVLYEDLLYKKFKQYSELTIRRIEFGSDFLKSKDGYHPVEVVIPLFKVEKKSDINLQMHNPNQIVAAQYNPANLYAPFDNWLFYKIYGASENENDILKYLEYFQKNELDNVVIEKSYFMRYADPLPHIRLRIKSDKTNLISFMLVFNSFLNNLQSQRLISKYILDNYCPEIERYGGKSLMDIAESLFEIDSQLVFHLLDYSSYDKEKLGVVTLIHYFEAFNVPYLDQIKLLEQSVGSNSYIDDFKKKKKEFVETIDPFNSWTSFQSESMNREILDILSKRNPMVNEYLINLTKGTSLTNSFEDIILSIIHLHFNRLFGTDRNFENKIHYFALQTLIGQKFKRKVTKTNDYSQNIGECHANCENDKINIQN